MADIYKLREELERARQNYEGWAMTNVAGKSPMELTDIDIGYRQAQNRYLCALAAYTNAINQELE